MLAIRMQRTGRSGHAQFRVIVQDSRFSPTRGRVVSYLGSYNPYTKAAAIDSQKAAQYLQNGARPSNSVARLFKKEGIKLPAWVKLDQPKKREVRNPEKRRSTAPAKPETVTESSQQAEAIETTEVTTGTDSAESPSEETAPQAESEPGPTAEAPNETSTQATEIQEPAETAETPTEESADEAPAESTENS